MPKLLGKGLLTQAAEQQLQGFSKTKLTLRRTAFPTSWLHMKTTCKRCNLLFLAFASSSNLVLSTMACFTCQQHPSSASKRVVRIASCCLHSVISSEVALISFSTSRANFLVSQRLNLTSSGLSLVSVKTFRVDIFFSMSWLIFW